MLKIQKRKKSYTGMKYKINRLSLVFVALLLLNIISPALHGQERIDSLIVKTGVDTLVTPDDIDSLSLIGIDRISFTYDEAVKYLTGWYSSSDRWKRKDDPLRMAMARVLFEATHDPFYNTETFLAG